MQTEVLMAERQGAAQAVAASEQRYQSLLASTTDYVYTVTLNHGRSVTTAHGPGCEAVTGFTSREFDAEASLWYRMIHEEDRPAVLAQVARIVRGEVPGPLEHRIVHKDGRTRWIRNVPVPQRDPQGRVVAYSGLISDITDRKRAEQLLAVQYAVTRQLAESGTLPEAVQRTLKAICETLPWDWAAFWSFDAKTNTLQWSGIQHSSALHLEEFAQLSQAFSFGSGVGLPGRVWASGQLAWVPDVVQDRDFARAAAAAGVGLHGACALPIRRGEEVAGVIELLSRKVQPPDPHMMQMLAAVGAQLGQFLERTRAEEALRRSCQTQEALNALLSLSLQDISLEDTLLRVIDHVLAIPWLSLEAKAGVFVVEADPFALVLKAQRNLPASLQAACGHVAFGRCLCGRVAASGKMEFAAHVDDRHETSYLGMSPHGHFCVPIVSAGKVLGVINLYVKENHRRESKEDEFLSAVANVVGGIIQRKRAEEDLKKALAGLTTAHEELKTTHEELQATEFQLIQAAKLECIGTLAAGVAHEVKNPLQTMLMGLHYLAHNLPVNQEGIALALHDMRDAVARAKAILGGLLELSATTKSETSPQDLNLCVQRSLDLLHYELVATQTTVLRQLAADLPLVAMDRGKMEQVLLNLFLNALHAMSHGGTLTITTRAIEWSENLAAQERILRPFKPGAALAVIEVQDTGSGIPDALLPRVFDPFFTTKPVGHGTGLGLAVVKKIVDLHGGAIDIRNTPAGGVRVTMVLKLDPEEIQ